MLGKQLQTAAAGNAGGAGAYIEDVFSTYLYTGNNTTNTITNGIDLSGEGGLVWVKHRDGAASHALHDTERGASKRLFSNLTNAESTVTSFTSFNSDGFTLASDSAGNVNYSGFTYASWTFRKAPKFFDVVTYTGTGSTQNISHNLGSVPGVIIIKPVTFSDNWIVYHRSLGNNYNLKLNSTDSAGGSSEFAYTSPTSSVFTVSSDYGVNGSGQTFVAYLFAHDAGGFGDDGTESVIKCGGWTGTGSQLDVNLGWEPQFLIVKSAVGDADHWYMYDNMRGFLTSSDSTHLRANANYVESANNVKLTSTGFRLGSTDTNKYGKTYIYIAIRRGPMKTPTDATEVFSVQELTGNGSATTITTGFPVDLTFAKAVSDSSASWWWVDRLRGETKYLSSNSTNAEATYSSNPTELDNNTGVVDKNYGSTTSVFADYLFRRAPGFFDVVAYQGTGVAHTENHNLGVVPEMMIIRHRNRAGQHWCVYHKDLGNFYRDRLNLDIAASGGNNFFNSTDPTSSVFTVGTDSEVNNSASGYIAYLFATVSNVSKVGSYTGTGTTNDIDCGFASGARFVLIKRTDDSGYSWYVWDTARGIVSGNDPYLLINSTAAEVTSTDYIDPLSSGFQISSSAPAAINASGGSYIFLAIA